MHKYLNITTVVFMKKSLIIVLTVLFFVPACKNPHAETLYLASEMPYVVLYQYTREQQLLATDTLTRGTAVQAWQEKPLQYQGKTYTAVLHKSQRLYVVSKELTDNPRKAVAERVVYVRTPASVIDDTLTSHICGLAEKGQAYEVTDYDYLLPDGTVHRYLIRHNDTMGYIFGKYTVSTDSLARLRYMPERYDSIFSKVRNPFGGGKAIDCDYFPREKPQFTGNIMPEPCYSLYLNISPAVIGKIDDYIALAKQTRINTFVIDIKDNECPGYKAEAMRLYSPTNHKWGGKNKAAMYQYAVQRLHEEGFYVVGRITCFKDTYFVKDNPECAITDKSTGQPFYHNKAHWPSPYDRKVWQFNVELAKEAVRTFGFNEINFDYVRFPDRLMSVESQIDYHNTYNESKVQAIQRFVQYACDELHELNTYVSIDVFGESAYKGYTTPYGQFWPALSNVADVMCGMPYPDHFASGYAGLQKPWNNPYHTLNTWGKTVQNRQAETPSPAKVRTWVQAYPVMRHIDPEGIDYNAANIEKAIRGLFDAGCCDGYITWLSSSSLSRYQMQAPAFSIDYTKE